MSSRDVIVLSDLRPDRKAMSRKPLALTALTLGAAVALTGCAGGERSPLEYLKGTWSCGDGTAGEYNFKAFTATFDGERAEFHSDDEWTGGILPGYLEVSEKDGQIVIHDPNGNQSLVVLPETMPQDGYAVQLPFGGSTISPEVHFIASIDGDSFALTLDKISGGGTVWDMGNCTRQ